MPIFVFTILTPTLAFYIYALVQFWAEFRRRRRGEVQVVELHDSRLVSDDFESLPGTQPKTESETESADRANAAIRPFLIPAAQRAPLFATCLKNQQLACGSPAAIPAFKRSAKG